MYCRNCGENIFEKDLICKKCKTKKGEGVNYCHICGHSTNARQDNCRSCGAKLSKIIPQSQRQARIQQLNNGAKKLKLLTRIEGVISITCLVLIVLCFLIIEFRPKPEGIPDIGYDVVQDYEGNINIYGPEYRSRFASSDVQDFWNSNSTILGFAIGCFIVFINSVIMWLVNKNQYKRTIRKIEEEKKYVL